MAFGSCSEPDVSTGTENVEADLWTATRAAGAQEAGKLAVEARDMVGRLRNGGGS